jgi:hypothetical protein
MSFTIDPSMAKNGSYDFTVSLYDSDGNLIADTTSFLVVAGDSSNSGNRTTSQTSSGSVKVNKTTPNEISRSKKSVAVSSNISYDLGSASSGKIVITYDEGDDKVIVSKDLTDQTATIDIPFKIDTSVISNYYDYTVTLYDPSGKVIDQSGDYVYIDGTAAIGA